MQLLLILMALLLPPGAGAEEIIGGREARPHSHPYMAYLLIQTPMEVFACGGFLVRKDFVMTAAHCLGSTITITLGAHNISREERTQQRISVLRAIPHPRYRRQNFQNDIMLLQLTNRARRNQFVRPVALPRSQAQLRPGSRCTVAGWGMVSQNRRTDTLRDVQLSVQRNQVCSNLFNIFNGQSQICVGNQRERKTAFKGDSGGPLVCNNVAKGIVSYGSRVGTPPEVFTKVSSYMPWINRTMRCFKTAMNQKRHHTTPHTMDSSSLGQSQLRKYQQQLLGSLPWKMQLLLILMALLLPPGAGAEEIIGGREARPHSHPYMAYLRIQTPRGVFACGGFLVREDFVMTAAHCLGSTITVILGAHNISREERTQQRISVLRAIPHPAYNEDSKLNDIMLLQLTNRARKNRFVRPVALPRSQAQLRPGSQCTVAGWGMVSQNRRTDTLRDVQLKVQSNQLCSNLFHVYNGQKEICVGNQTERKTAFKGDSGGPLVCNNVAQGIVSRGSSTGTPPAVFTKVSSYLPWINRTMRRFKMVKNQKSHHTTPPMMDSSLRQSWL
ncbi:uncharacterized protein AAES06_024979 [Glossophaga mutica]